MAEVTCHEWCHILTEPLYNMAVPVLQHDDFRVSRKRSANGGLPMRIVFDPTEEDTFRRPLFEKRKSSRVGRIREWMRQQGVKKQTVGRYPDLPTQVLENDPSFGVVTSLTNES